MESYDEYQGPAQDSNTNSHDGINQDKQQNMLLYQSFTDVSLLTHNIFKVNYIELFSNKVLTILVLKHFSQKNVRVSCIF